VLSNFTSYFMSSSLWTKRANFHTQYSRFLLHWQELGTLWLRFNLLDKKSLVYL